MHGKEYIRLMNSKEWRRIRAAKLSKDPYCEECLKKCPQQIRIPNQMERIVELL